MGKMEHDKTLNMQRWGLARWRRAVGQSGVKSRLRGQGTCTSTPTGHWFCRQALDMLPGGVWHVWLYAGPPS